MKFRKKYTKITVAAAMLHGVLIGIAAVAIVGFIIVGTNGKGKEKAVESDVVAVDPPQESEKAPASGPAVSAGGEIDGDALKLFAKQHGVFSSAASAQEFVALDPALAKAAVVEAEGQFYVWSAVGIVEEEIAVSEDEGTFRKPFFASMSSCSSVGAGQLRKALSETELSQIKIMTTSTDDGNEDEKIADFRKNLVAVTAFTSDLRVVRLQLLSHYSHKDGCVDINF